MARWDISPSDASINSSGVASFPSNTSNVAKIYTVTYTDDAGCGGSTTYTVPACPPPPPTPVDCNAYSFSDKLPTQPVAGNTSMVIATSSKSKGQLTVGSKDSWITYVTTDSDSSSYYYKFKAASNTGGSYRTGTVTFTSSDGCEFTAHMQQEGRTCQCSDIESGIVYKSTYLPTSSQSNLLLFSADTKGCGSISAYCSSSQDSIFSSDDDNLVKVVEVEANRKYEVRANVLSLPSGHGARSCIVNIDIKKENGSICKTVDKLFVQDPNINCSKSYDYGSYKTVFYRNDSGEVVIAESLARYEYNSQIVYILEKLDSFDPTSWISSDSNFKYVLGDDNKWKVYATISANPLSADRQVAYKTTKYILDNPVTQGTRYSPSQLRSMSTTVCGEGRNVDVVQYGCNCNIPVVYGGLTVGADEGEHNDSVLPYGFDTSCVRLTGATKKDTCTWISDISVSDGKYLHFRVTKNNVAEERKCTLVLHLTDDYHGVCEKDLIITQKAGEVQINCNSCDSVKNDGILSVYPTIWNASYTDNLMLVYSRKLEDDCGGTVTLTTSTAGVTNPMTGFRLKEVFRGTDGKAYCSFVCDANTSSEEKHAKMTFSYRKGSVSCSEVYDVTQKGKEPTPASGCTSQSYNFEVIYLSGNQGKTSSNPVTFSAGEYKKIGSLANTVTSACCGVEVTTTHTSSFGDITLTSRSGGGYDIYARAFSGAPSQDATIDVKWWYEDSSGTRHYPESAIIYVRNNG